jgi:hypothetical protein
VSVCVCVCEGVFSNVAADYLVSSECVSECVSK